MLFQPLSGLRARLLLLALLAAAPLLALEIYASLAARQRETEAISQQVAQLTRLASASFAQVFEGERQLLAALARLPAVHAYDGETCSAVLADLLAQYPFYANLAAITPAGEVFCSAIPQDGIVNVADRPYFQRALATGDFALGDYSVGRVSGLPTIIGAVPVYSAGELRAVVLASLKLEYLRTLAESAELPAGAALTVMDQNATVLARYPDHELWVGQTRPDAPVIDTARTTGFGLDTALGIDGVERLYAFEVVPGTGPASLYVSVGIPTDVAYAEAWMELGRRLGVIAIIVLLATTAAWAGSDRLILRPIQKLVAATERLMAGDLTARSGILPGPGEVRHLAQTFDEMAGSLEQREARLKTVNRLLRMLSECNQALVRATDERSLLDSVCGSIVEFGGRRPAWVSLLGEKGVPRLAALAGAGPGVRAALEPRGEPDDPAPRLAAAAIAGGQAVVIHDLNRAPEHAALLAAFGSPGCASVIALPILSQGQALGVLGLGAAEPEAFSDEEVRLLEELAGDLAYGVVALRTGLARERAEAQARTAGERARALADLSRELALVTTDVEAAARAVVRQAVQLVGDGASLRLLTPDGDHVVPVAQAHRDPQAAELLHHLLRAAPMRARDGLSGRVLAEDRPIMVSGAGSEAMRAAFRDELQSFLDRFTVACLLIVPLRAQGENLGTLTLSRLAPGGDYTPDEQNYVQAIADRGALVIANARLYEAAQRLNAELEQRVAKRTAELATSNVALEAENTERRRAEEQVRQLNTVLGQRAAALEAANRELEAFSYSVSHDLRAPLRGIDGFSLALVEDYGDRLDATAHDYVRRVRAGAQRMAALIDDLLNLSRVARAEMRWEAVDLSALAETVAADLRPSQPERQVRFDIRPGLTAWGDSRLLRVALENLLGNAWKFTGQREAAVIELDRHAAGEAPTFVVRDNGAGFDMTYAHRLFGAFQRLHDEREFAGTGIGLATVQRIIHRHGGRVWAESTVGEGAAFYFSLAPQPEPPPAD